ncbi:MAG: PEP/pyruvate-binding domain-containing protein, partial [Candidatus Saccharimonadales bacterium]|nr:PEP/pyruvate-binding domain-containing protein [Candidatus Saccharimonadales bacterium]
MADPIFGANRITSESAGHKAYHLHQLQQAGFKVPRFIAIPTSTLSQLAGRQLEPILKTLSSVDFNDQKSISKLSKQLTKIIDEIDIDSETIQKIDKQITAIMPAAKKYAVRSSATVEDSPEASFAGQFNSSLDVAKNEIPLTIKNCWKSLYRPSVITYCLQRGLPADELGMGVIVQEMVEADMAGVAFSANPQGLLNEMVIVVGEGVNAEAIQNSQSVSTYFYNVSDDIYYVERLSKERELPQPVLSKLIDQIKEATKSFGRFIDIEFAIKDNEINLLQVREITTLTADETIILDNSNIVESYPGITLPLTESFAKAAYYQIFRGLFVRGIHKNALDEEYEHLLKNMV